MSDAKKVKSYRLSEETIAEIKRVAGLAGISEAAVIEQWAFDGNGHGAKIDGAEKKSGRRVEVLPAGVNLGSELKAPAVKKVVVGGNRAGRTFIMGTGQIEDLAGQRVGRAPLPRPGDK